MGQARIEVPACVAFLTVALMLAEHAVGVPLTQPPPRERLPRRGRQTTRLLELVHGPHQLQLPLAKRDARHLSVRVPSPLSRELTLQPDQCVHNFAQLGVGGPVAVS